MDRADRQTRRNVATAGAARACLIGLVLVSGCMQFRQSAAVMTRRRMDSQASKGASPVVNAAYQVPAGIGNTSGVVTGNYQVPAKPAGPEVVPAGLVGKQNGQNPPSRLVASGCRATTYGPAPCVTHLPQTQPEPMSTPPIAVPQTAGKDPTAPSVLPISLDNVFRLAEEQNNQVGIARERVREAFAEKKIAAARWLPDVWVGSAYYRHDGGIQNFNGNLVQSNYGSAFAGMETYSQLDLREYGYQKLNAQRQVWQQKGELSRVTTESMTEAASTYLDLLAARTGDAIAQKMEADLKTLLERAKSLAAKEPAAEVEVKRIRAELLGHQQVRAKLRQQAEAASAKLAYLLGVDPCTEMLPIDNELVPIELVDATPACCDLVAQALATGPGIQEMEGLLGLIYEAMDKAQGPTKYIPVLGVRVAEGAFGAGPGGSSTWDNRFDLGLQARWNLTEYALARQRRCVTLAKMQQAQLAYLDLRAKLTAGVQASRAEILGGREQIKLGQSQITDARDAQKMSFERLKLNVQGSSHSEVLLAIRSVALAQLNYLTAVSAYNKAQVRLMVLLGPNAPECRQLPPAE